MKHDGSLSRKALIFSGGGRYAPWRSHASYSKLGRVKDEICLINRSRSVIFRMKGELLKKSNY